jgi:UDP-N-acetylglucosamine diphosphorylase/glucosamine-1-phosphate N-acetyltransferase
MTQKDPSVSAKPLATVIMAAGKGKRMNNPEMAKVLYEVDGRPLIDYVVSLALGLNSAKIVVVVGHRRDLVVRHVAAQFGAYVTFVEQHEQLGTGHAVLQAEKVLQGFQGDVLVLSGDVPLLSKGTLTRLIAVHRRYEPVATILTAEMNSPAGYGRILRQSDGSVKRIVEDKDASAAEKRVKEINSGIYVFNKVELFDALKHLEKHNVQNEYYLTDVFETFWKKKQKVLAVKTRNHNEVRGVNTPKDLRDLQEVFSRRSVSIGNT